MSAVYIDSFLPRQHLDWNETTHHAKASLSSKCVLLDDWHCPKNGCRCCWACCWVCYSKRIEINIHAYCVKYLENACVNACLDSTVLLLYVNMLKTWSFWMLQKVVLSRHAWTKNTVLKLKVVQLSKTCLYTLQYFQPDLTIIRIYFTRWLIRMNSYDLTCWIVRILQVAIRLNL